MLVSIGHVTNYSAGRSRLLQRAKPAADAAVVRWPAVVSWSIEMPHIDEAVRFRDSFGNIAHLVVLPKPLSEISIVARGTVETRDRAGVARGMVEIAPIEGLQAHNAAHGTGRCDPRPGRRHERDRADIRTHAQADGNAVHERVEYAIGTTNAATTAAEAFKAGQGVCQDHAHIFISAARVLDLPARYVNGYFLTDSDSPAEAHHAWAEVWLDRPRLGRLRCGEQYVPHGPLRPARLRARFGIRRAHPWHPPGGRRGGA